jgi:hypothetical protein
VHIAIQSAHCKAKSLEQVLGVVFGCRASQARKIEQLSKIVIRGGLRIRAKLMLIKGVRWCDIVVRV